MTYNYEEVQPATAAKAYRAGLYIRLSREDGDKAESDSVVNQKHILENFVLSNPDIRHIETYVDDGFSGTSFDRPAFLRMMADIYAGKINCVIVKDSSRFGRNASESGRYIGEIFPCLRVRYIAVNDLIDSGRSQSAAVEYLNNNMRWMINEYYVVANSESIRSSLNMERQQGAFIGSFAKYGYKKDPADYHKLVIDEAAAETVRLIFRLYLSGVGIRGIVRRLNESGIPNPSTYKCLNGLNYKARTVDGSALWCDKTVRRTLQDRMYIGDMVQGKCQKINYKTKVIRSCSPDEWIIVKGTHEAIIDADDFYRAQRMLQRGVKGSTKSGGIDLFAGLLKCADCGHALIKKTNRNPDKDYVYYKCSSHLRCKSACATHTISYERLYNCVLYCIRQMVDIAVDADEVIKEMRRDRASAAGVDIKKQIRSQEHELEKVKKLLADLYPDYKSGLLNKDQYLINKQEFEQKQTELEHIIEQLKVTAESSEPSVESNDFIEHFKRHGNIEALTRPILTELIDKITVHQDNTLDITFNFSDTFPDTDALPTCNPA